jgi:hypothetical protein
MKSIEYNNKQVRIRKIIQELVGRRRKWEAKHF